MRNRLAVLAVGVMTGVVGSLVVAVAAIPERAHAEPMIEVVATPATAPTIWFEDIGLDITVSNPGTEPLSAVDLTVTIETANRYVASRVTGPVVEVGNADDFLDPGEQWAYEAVVETEPDIIVEATATAPDSSTVMTSQSVRLGDLNPAGVLFPVDTSIVPDVTSTFPGGPVQWTVTATNISSFSIVEFAAEHRVLYPDFRGPINYTPLGSPVVDGDGDDTLSPGEVWIWEVDEVVDVDGSYLEVSMTMLRADAEAPNQLIFDIPQSDPVSVAVAPTTQPTETTQPVPTPPDDAALPGTGGDVANVVLAVLIALSGVLLIALSRSRPSTRSAGRNT